MIGGNTRATVKRRRTPSSDNLAFISMNSIGERVYSYLTVAELIGWLDYLSGDSQHTNYHSKIQESSHVFICDYQELRGITPENSRIEIDGTIYQIMLIDNPMNLNRQLEIYLKYVGGQSGG